MIFDLSTDIRKCLSIAYYPQVFPCSLKNFLHRVIQLWLCPFSHLPSQSNGPGDQGLKKLSSDAFKKPIHQDHLPGIKTQRLLWHHNKNPWVHGCLYCWVQWYSVLGVSQHVFSVPNQIEDFISSHSIWYKMCYFDLCLKEPFSGRKATGLGFHWWLYMSQGHHHGSASGHFGLLGTGASSTLLVLVISHRPAQIIHTD